MKLKNFLIASLMAIMTVATFSINAASAAGTYKISCKNNAYGMHLGSDYTQVAYVYNALQIGGALGNDMFSYLIGSDFNQAYVGNDCLYAGAADTNGTAVVAGDVARIAVNAIVGAVSNRIDMAFAARDSGASATGLSFTTQGDGFSMAANKLLGGLSFWADYGNSNMENTQTFTNVRIDSMRFDGDASSYSLGVDKVFGKALFGIVVSNIDTDITTEFNSGTYKQTVDTYGIYFAYKTRMLQIDLGTGQGDSKVTTTRRDLGNDSVINGKTTADIEYSHARLAANFTRGRFTLVPSASYRTMDMDIAAFTDDRGDEGLTITGDQELFALGNTTVGVTDDEIATRNVTSETISLGMKLSANLGKIVPYVGFSYDSEDTTKASFKSEAGTDGNDGELKASDYTDSIRYGVGMNFMLGSHVTGGVRAGQITGRDDWKESYMSGTLSIGF
ncbi:autotransporter outer membrane beta-barrel domain-containing protein [Alphaproteobacteria bacterium]|nr:autotransporter outer membrane beta-barrel domain-containing protein [Alphaproteobacteria bacterium]